MWMWVETGRDKGCGGAWGEGRAWEITVVDAAARCTHTALRVRTLTVVVRGSTGGRPLFGLLRHDRLLRPLAAPAHRDVLPAQPVHPRHDGHRASHTHTRTACPSRPHGVLRAGSAHALTQRCALRCAAAAGFCLFNSLALAGGAGNPGQKGGSCTPDR